MDVDLDFSDVDSWFEDEKSNVLAKECEIGKDAVQYAKDNGNYKDHTGHLRASSESEVDEDGILLKNEADYASYVESKGYDVLGSAALHAEKQANEEFE